MGRGFQRRFQRLELKYLIDEPTAVRIRRGLEPYCLEDANGAVPAGDALRSQPRGYPVRTLYLDTPSLALHRAKERGDPERFKLRLRSYSARGPTVLELKQRSCDVIEKTRVVVAPDGIRAAALGLGKSLDDDLEARRFLGQFSRLVMTTGAAPSLLVRYWREAYSSRVDSYARVTFDRRVAAQRTRSWDLEGDSARWCELEHHLSFRAPRPFVVLEFKCQSRVPNWITELIQRFSLRRRSMSKYSIGIYMTGRRAGAPALVRRCAEVLQ